MWDVKNAITKLARQTSSAIHWSDCMDSCRAAGTEIALELGPGRALAKMADVIASDGVKIGTVDHLDGPDLEEVLVVEKRLVLKREIRIHRRTRAEVVEIPVSLRKQRVKLERE